MSKQNIGGLWKRDSGNLKYKGNITVDGKRIKIAVFNNQFAGGNRPDLTIVEDGVEDKDE